MKKIQLIYKNWLKKKKFKIFKIELEEELRNLYHFTEEEKTILRKPQFILTKTERSIQNQLYSVAKATAYSNTLSKIHQ